MLYGFHTYHPKETVEQDFKIIGKFLPPIGRLMLALIDKNAFRVGCLKSINEEIGKIKRMCLIHLSGRLVWAMPFLMIY